MMLNEFNIATRIFNQNNISIEGCWPTSSDLERLERADADLEVECYACAFDYNWGAFRPKNKCKPVKGVARMVIYDAHNNYKMCRIQFVPYGKRSRLLNSKVASIYTRHIFTTYEEAAKDYNQCVEKYYEHLRSVSQQYTRLSEGVLNEIVPLMEEVNNG